MQPCRNIFGYVCRASEMQRIVREPQMTLLNIRRLPLVLDLDDTLVRLVGNAPGRYVPEEVAKQGKKKNHSPAALDLVCSV